jgi:hypothetical protein
MGNLALGLAAGVISGVKKFVGEASLEYEANAIALPTNSWQFTPAFHSVQLLYLIPLCSMPL